MSEQTKIEWCDSTVNFWSGCTKVSAGCAHCYAETMDRRHLIEPVSHWGHGAPRLKSAGAVKMAQALNRKPWVCDECGRQLTESEKKLHELKGILDVKRHTCHRRRVFSLSRGDWLDAEAPIEWLTEMLDTIRQCDQLEWLLVTKRPELFKTRLLEALAYVEKVTGDWPDREPNTALGQWIDAWQCGEEIPKHIMVLTSVENQEQAEKRIPELLRIPASRRGLSCEPLLGMLNIKDALRCDVPIHWVIAGCESGPGRRELDGYTNRARMLRDHCRYSKVPFFHKQMPIGKRVSGDMAEWPEDLRVREFPIMARGGLTT